MIKTKDLKQIIKFNATPNQIYDTLMNSKKHSEFTNSNAKMNNKVNGKFTAYYNYIKGFNIELIKDKKIVQLWRCNDWPLNHYSEVTFSFKSIKGGTKLTFTQINIPIKQYRGIKQGWIDYYWRPLKELF